MRFRNLFWFVMVVVLLVWASQSKAEGWLSGPSARSAWVQGSSQSDRAISAAQRSGRSYYWRRDRNGTVVVVNPYNNGYRNGYGDNYYVAPQPRQVDHWDRARADYFRMNYGPGGVYAPYMSR